MARSLISLETGILESNAVKNASEISSFHETLHYIIKVATDKLQVELAQEIDSFDRKERQLLLFKKDQLVDLLNREIETANMTMEDGNARAMFMSEHEQRLQSKLSSYLQSQETLIADYKAKLQQRALKYARNFVIEMTEWGYYGEDATHKNEFMWKLHNVFASIVGALDTGDESFASKFNIAHILNVEAAELQLMDNISHEDKSQMSQAELPDLLHLMKLLQLIELVCESGVVQNKHAHLKVSTHDTILVAAQIVSRTLAMMPYFLKPDDDKLSIFIGHTFTSLAKVLSTPQCTNRFSRFRKKQPVEEPSSEETANKSKQAKKGTGSSGSTGSSVSSTNDSGSGSGTTSGHTTSSKTTEAEVPVEKEWTWGSDKFNFNEETLIGCLLFWMELAGDTRLNLRRVLPKVVTGGDIYPVTIIEQREQEEQLGGHSHSQFQSQSEDGTINETKNEDGESGLGSGSAIEDVSQSGISRLGDSIIDIESTAGIGFKYANSFVMSEHGREKISTMYDRLNLDGLFTLGSKTVGNILYCSSNCIALYLDPRNELVGEALYRLGRSLINPSTKLALIVLTQYTFQLGSARGYNYNDPNAVGLADEEACFAMKVATSEALKVMEVRATNYFVCINTMQCLYSCLLCYISAGTILQDDRENVDVSKEKQTKKEDQNGGGKKSKKMLSGSKGSKSGTGKSKSNETLEDLKTIFLRGMNVNIVTNILAVMCLHSGSLTVQYTGLQILRILIRKPFLSRNEIQDLMEDDDEEIGAAALDEPIDGDDDKDIASQTVARDFNHWRNDIWDNKIKKKKEEDTGQTAETWNLTDAMFYCSAHHMQSYEITEQILLLIQHVADLSFLCRVTLLERGVEKVLTRVQENMVHDVYIMALVEVCNETLQRVD